MGFNMSGSEVGRGECLQPRGSGPGHASPGKVFISRARRVDFRLLTQIFLTN